jgi:parallel beta-helix repeat protein
VGLGAGVSPACCTITGVGVAVMDWGQPRGGIFISYRREETAGQAGRLYDRLSDRFGTDRVFMDVDSIAIGVDFTRAVIEAVSGCEILLALIGREWSAMTDSTGQRRIDDPDDFVRIEIEAALQRDIRVVPVLVEGAALPHAGDLPPGLRPLVRRQALVLSHAGFRSEVSRLVAAVEEVLGAGPGPAAGPGDDAGRAAKAGPPTHVVDAFPGRGDFTTVSAAIEAAQPGDRIVVRPGLYEEALVMGKPLEIVGDGPAADTVIRARDAHVLLFQASVGRVANLTLRQAGGEQSWYGVDIAQGRLELEGCDISSQASGGVAVRGGANPRLRGNKIHDNKHAGVHVNDSGLGTVEDNDITGNTFSGVEIRTGGDPTVRGNKIHDNKGAGVIVYDSGLGTVEDNDITGNTLAGVEIKTGGDPTVRSNKIHDGKAGGVFVQASGLGKVEDNDITGNTFSGVEIKTGGDTTVRGNKIHGNKQSGVFVNESGLGTVEDNDITGNTYAGAEIKSGGNPTLRRNRINRNGYQAVWVYEDGRGVVEDNDLTGNAKGALLIAQDCQANVTHARNKE